MLGRLELLGAVQVKDLVGSVGAERLDGGCGGANDDGNCLAALQRPSTSSVFMTMTTLPGPIRLG